MLTKHAFVLSVRQSSRSILCNNTNKNTTDDLRIGIKIGNGRQITHPFGCWPRRSALARAAFWRSPSLAQTCKSISNSWEVTRLLFFAVLFSSTLLSLTFAVLSPLARLTRACLLASSVAFNSGHPWILQGLMNCVTVISLFPGFWWRFAPL